MAKFKVGDKVTDGDGVYIITDVDDGIYEWKLVSGKADPSHSKGGEIAWAENEMRLANSRACNSTNPGVQNAINARTAKNAGAAWMTAAGSRITDAEGAKRWNALWEKVEARKREADSLDRYLVSKKQYGYSATLESLIRGLSFS